MLRKHGSGNIKIDPKLVAKLWKSQPRFLFSQKVTKTDFFKPNINFEGKHRKRIGWSFFRLWM